MFRLAQASPPRLGGWLGAEPTNGANGFRTWYIHSGIDMNHKHTSWPVCLLLATSINVSASEDEAFHSSVQNHFVNAAIAGIWESGCEIDVETGLSRSLHLKIAGDTTVLQHFRFSDGACTSALDPSIVEGSMSLTGLHVDILGRYIYELAVTDDSENQHRILIHVDSQRYLTLIESNSPLRQISMHETNQGEAK
jgi:hypothetical protein